MYSVTLSKPSSLEGRESENQQKRIVPPFRVKRTEVRVRLRVSRGSNLFVTLKLGCTTIFSECASSSRRPKMFCIAK